LAAVHADRKGTVSQHERTYLFAHRPKMRDPFRGARATSTSHAVKTDILEAVGGSAG